MSLRPEGILNLGQTKIPSIQVVTLMGAVEAAATHLFWGVQQALFCCSPFLVNCLCKDEKRDKQQRKVNPIPSSAGIGFLFKDYFFRSSTVFTPSTERIWLSITCLPAERRIGFQHAVHRRYEICSASFVPKILIVAFNLS